MIKNWAFTEVWAIDLLEKFLDSYPSATAVLFPAFCLDWRTSQHFFNPLDINLHESSS
ncbi:hypothetical protein Nhal_1670 [Nitrosococcus halophilus Nc 4]|uniref:Uncharacterized protein n=1 Tax=Nitrosococcus halophilus (strain Nc4) TaxID=472759 RepID=D5C2D9_NITHN|nr:hypothetical protein Nhal_1670 [Nitrosococcus halophilus Nc 4]